MKINYLKINGYKNLKSKAIFADINTCTNYLALIGLNGSGKSNVLEAVSIIFACLFNKSKTAFSYEIKYDINNFEVSVLDGKMSVKDQKILKNEIDNYLPQEIIACYSGEDRRLWDDIYKEFYFDFFDSILKKKASIFPKLLYVNRYCWEIALISLLCSGRKTLYSPLSSVS